MPDHDAHVARLTALMETVRLGLEPAEGGGWTITYERERHPIARLPLDDLDPAAEAAEIMAVAAAFEAAAKYPGQPEAAASLREDTATILPKIERRRFAAAYDAVIAGRGEGDAARLFHQPFGDELIVAYVHDAGWRFTYVAAGRVAAWDTSPGTIHSVARSNLYHRHELDFRARELRIGDGYDAARATIIGDVYFDREGPGGIPLAVPGRDTLLLGPDLDPAAVRAAYEAATYPISPWIHAFRHDTLVPRTV